MTAREISRIAHAARKAGCSTLLQLHIAGELIHRGEATLISLANTLGLTLEAIALACAQMETAGGIKVITCRQTIGFTIVRLSKAAMDEFTAILNSPDSQPRRPKKIPL